MRRTLTLAALIALAAPAFPVSAQTPPPAPPASQPASRPASARETASKMLAPDAARRKPLQPIPGQVQQDKTTVNPVAPGSRPVMLRREGGFVVDRTGRVTKSADGRDFEFNFEADASAMQDPPMVLLPNLALMMVQDQLRLSGRDLRFRVTGMVTEYLGRNYLLLQKVVTVNE